MKDQLRGQAGASSREEVRVSKGTEPCPCVVYVMKKNLAKRKGGDEVGGEVQRGKETS